MAVSDLLPRKSMGSKSRRQTLHDRLDYDQKKEKPKELCLCGFPFNGSQIHLPAPVSGLPC